ncbi:carboxypeptidase-like regulatory domain-containing protein [Rhodopirellula sp. JC740]|uniref:Carboxypeptidase-like regulatory domain-containing protein n=1 Tax=Rhodopirellula halodulae TaxID=2894198 RepID=A0ABS8NEZ8_9BACT|nr:carboxypeptidase-like regulatory domain-containing protein [Rhodopirellula sp. JC740]MCC9642130.1 carboxypeptidase-like regulatory domain-containing protein [Rhodopirellula sp. JC740]
MSMKNILNMIAVLSIAATSVVSMTGCGPSAQADYASIGLVPITGTVTLDGQPVEGAVVQFVAPDTTFSYGTTDAEGHYEMKFNSEVMGVPPGDKIVRISTTTSTGEVDTEGADDDDDAPRRRKKKTRDPNEKIPAAYNEDSQIKATVSAGQVVYDFALKSDGSAL